MIVLRNKEPELEQREFGFYTSKIKRPIQVRIGKTRAGLYKKISDSAANSYKKVKIAGKNGREKYLGSQDFSDQNPVRNYLYEEANKARTNINLGDFQHGSFNHKAPKGQVRKLKNDPAYLESQLKKNPKNEFQIKDSIAGRHSIAINPKRHDLATLAHEIGHAKNYTGLNGKLNKKIHFKANDSKNDDLRKGKRNKELPGNRGSLKTHVLQNLEEINASRSGIKMLKDSGMSKEEVKKAQKKFKEAYKTYLHNSIMDEKLKLAKKLEFKGGNSIRHRSPKFEKQKTILTKLDKKQNRLPKKLRNSMNELQNTIKDINKK